MFRFTIRDVLWLMVVAVVLGWWSEVKQLSKIRHEATINAMRLDCLQIELRENG